MQYNLMIVSYAMISNTLILLNVCDDITIPLLIIWVKNPWTFAEPPAKSKTDIRHSFDKQSDVKPFLACDSTKYSQLLLSETAAKISQKQ